MSLSWFWSNSLLLSRPFLWLLLIVNALGTLYGYVWYGDQLAETAQTHPLWQLVFVPDSPTASLFFCLAVLYLLFPPKTVTKAGLMVRAAVEGLAVLTSVKYGIWAVCINFAGQAQGDPLEWQNWMLIVSHGSMALEALLYVRFFIFGRTAAFAALLWLLLNDTVDYSYGVNPWLGRAFDDDMAAVRNFTFGLSAASYLAVRIALISRKQ